MAIKNPFKLEKLKIKAYKKRSRSVADYIGTFEAMFNPESFSQKYEIIYGPHSKNKGFGARNEQVDYARSKSAELSLELIIDGTGVNEMGIFRLGRQKSVKERVDDFLKLAFRIHGDIHEPAYLVAEWGDLIFSCRLESVDIQYTSFNRDGTALRAKLAITLLSDKTAKKKMAEDNTNSPDLTHSRIVKSGDTLPLLAKEIYGSSSYYLWVAQANNLDDFRNLIPGQEILFPPLEP